MTTQEKIEDKINTYFDNEYEWSDWPRVCPDIEITEILPTDTGYYVEGKILVEICVDDYDDGEFDATLDKDFNIIDLNWDC